MLPVHVTLACVPHACLAEPCMPADKVPEMLGPLVERLVWGMDSSDADVKVAAITALSSAAAATEAQFAPFAGHVLPALASFLQLTRGGHLGPHICRSGHAVYSMSGTPHDTHNWTAPSAAAATALETHGACALPCSWQKTQTAAGTGAAELARACAAEAASSIAGGLTTSDRMIRSKYLIRQPQGMQRGRLDAQPVSCTAG